MKLSELKQKRKDERYAIAMNCLIAAAIACFVMLFTYLIHKNTLLGGENTVLRMDLYHQYGPLYAELYDRIVNGGSLLYSWTSGLGGSFLGNLFNYCASPFAFVILLAGHKNMPEAIAIMILLKAMCASASFTYYLNRSTKHTEFFTAIFGVFYTFCGFFVAYSWNIMWLDAMVLFPLVILGVEWIIRGKTPVLLIATLTLTMITNYYMAYMVCILSCLYFLFYYYGVYSLELPPRPKKERTERKRRKASPAGEGVPETAAADAGAAAADAAETVLPNGFAAAETQTPPAPAPQKKRAGVSAASVRAAHPFFSAGVVFAFCGILSFLLAAFALLPVKYCLDACSATHNTFPEDAKYYFHLFDFLANHLPGVEPTIRSSGDIVIPNVYSGLLTALLIPFFFLSEKIPARRKIAAASFIAVFYVSFVLNMFNYIWHGFHFPNDLPYRFSFAYSFLLLILAFEALRHIGEFSRRQYVTAGIVTVLFVAVVQKVGSKNVGQATVIITLLFTVMYCVIAGLRTSRSYSRKAVSVLLMFVMVLEILIANTSNYLMSQPKANYAGDYDDYKAISALAESGDDTPFYRTELTKLRARMDPCWYGYNGVSTFSSMAYESTSKLMRKIGFFGNNINSYTYYPQTPVFNSMFSMRYLYDNSDMLHAGYLYEDAGQNDSFHAFRYKYYLPIAFTVSGDTVNWDTSAEDAFDVQEDLFKRATGRGADIYEHTDITDFTSENINELTLEHMNAVTVFTAYKTDKSDTAKLTLHAEVEEDGEYFLYAGSNQISQIHIQASDFDYNYATNGVDPFIIGVGAQKKGDRISVEYNVNEDSDFANITFSAVRLDEKAFKAGYDVLTKGAVQISEFSDTGFTGTVEADRNDSFIFTSIPYDESWQVYVDGALVSYATAEEIEAGNTAGKALRVGDGLLGFHIEKGSHTLTLTYEPMGLMTGLAFTMFGITLVLLIVLFVLVRRYLAKKKASAADQTARAGITQDAGTAPLGETGTDSDTVGVPAPERKPASEDFTIPEWNSEGSDTD